MKALGFLILQPHIIPVPRRNLYMIFWSIHSFSIGFVTQNFTPDNVVRLEPFGLAMFCVYQNLKVVPAPRKRV